jgi:hypothetical protein
MIVYNGYCVVTGVPNVVSVSISANHGSACATATITGTSTTLILGDLITIDLGYENDHGIAFTGYVKQIERSVGAGTYTITAYDYMIRAQDYFIASANPKTPMTYKNISAEELVRQVMATAGLNSFEYTASHFTFGINNSFEVNLVSAYDYSRMIGDLITWSIWADPDDGTINFKNRKPYVMDGNSGQVGDVADVVSYILDYEQILDWSVEINERDLRNRVVVYGRDGVYAARRASGFAFGMAYYKTSVLSSPGLVDDAQMADDIAVYNLRLLNRLYYNISMTIVGAHYIQCRRVMEFPTADAPADISNFIGNWYVYGVDHNFDVVGGYTTNLNLRATAVEMPNGDNGYDET